MKKKYSKKIIAHKLKTTSPGVKFKISKEIMEKMPRESITFMEKHGMKIILQKVHQLVKG